jgi:hypothetical protein
MNPRAVDPVNTFGMPPVDRIHLCADRGCEQVGMTMFRRLKSDRPFYPEFSIREERALRQEQIKRGHDTAMIGGESAFGFALATAAAGHGLCVGVSGLCSPTLPEVESGEALGGLGVVKRLDKKSAGYENLIGLLHG